MTVLASQLILGTCLYVKDRTEAPRPHQKVGRRGEGNLANDQFHLYKWDISLYRHSVYRGGN
jgi:hypothetical protein